jgi:hypothetical protein
MSAKSTIAVVEKMVRGSRMAPPGAYPLGPAAKVDAAPPAAQLPKKLNDLSRARTFTYDLSVHAASKLGIPILGSASGDYSRRVVVLERSAFKKIDHADVTWRYGYAIRLALTVTKRKGDLKVNLPWLAASAELGQIEATWILEVVGLSGEAIDKATITPTQLNVETFVIAKQSLERLIDAVRHKDTVFTAEAIGVERPVDVVEREYLVGAARSYALSRLEKGRTLKQALDDVRPERELVTDAIADAYKEYAEITSRGKKPSEVVRARARDLLGKLKCRQY